MADRIIEIAPIAFLRGRTLSNAYIIVDEGQNMTRGQINMVLTRLGHGSTMVVTGDPDQSDLDAGDSGLMEVVGRLDGKCEQVAVVTLENGDVVRHPVVGAILPYLMAA